MLDKSSFHFGGVWSILLLFILFLMEMLFANNVDPDQTIYPYQRNLLSFRMRSRSSMPSRANSSVDLMVIVSCCLTLQICLIIALSFRCRPWRLGFVNGQVSLAWSIALCTQVLYTRPHALKERWREERTRISSLNFFQAVFTHVVVESSQPPAAESMSRREQKEATCTTSSLSGPT